MYGLKFVTIGITSLIYHLNQSKAKINSKVIGTKKQIQFVRAAFSYGVLTDSRQRQDEQTELKGIQ